MERTRLMIWKIKNNAFNKLQNPILKAIDPLLKAIVHTVGEEINT